MSSTPNYVIIPFLGKLEMTDALVRQIVDQGEVEHIYMCDNSTTPTITDWPWRDLQYDAVETFFCPGWNLHRMWNYGIHWAVVDAYHDFGPEDETPPVVNVGVFNNDLILDTPNFVSTMAAALRSSPEIGQVAASTTEWPADAPRAIPATYAQGFHGACVMVRGELPFRFDDRFRWYYGDSDFQAQLANAGYTNCIATQAKYTHIDGGHVSLRETDRDAFNASVAQDEVLFYAKWPQIRHGEYWIPENLLYYR